MLNKVDEIRSLERIALGPRFMKVCQERTDHAAAPSGQEDGADGKRRNAMGDKGKKDKEKGQKQTTEKQQQKDKKKKEKQPKRTP
jgi:hypothetical protein